MHYQLSAAVIASPRLGHLYVSMQSVHNNALIQFNEQTKEGGWVPRTSSNQHASLQACVTDSKQ